MPDEYVFYRWGQTLPSDPVPPSPEQRGRRIQPSLDESVHAESHCSRHVSVALTSCNLRLAGEKPGQPRFGTMLDGGAYGYRDGSCAVQEISRLCEAD